ncbi:hemagglutinin repeat-containing protein [Ralstonia flatus]
MKVTTTGALSATGTNAAGGNATFQGAGVSLARSQTSVNGNLVLNSSGNVDLTGASTHAGGTVNANAAGAFVNDAGRLSGNGPVQVTAGSVSNAGGQIVSQAAVGVQSTGAVNNTQGTVQAAGALAVSGSTIDNTAGRLVSLNADGLTVNAATSITNAAGTTADGAQGGVIGGNGAATITTHTLTNRGQISAATDAALNAATLDNSNGSMKAGRTLAANVTGAVINQHGTLSADTTNVSAGSIDNSAGTIEGNQLGLTTTGNLSNRDGTINQVGQTDTTLQVGGAFDNSGGTIAANAQNLNVNAQSLINDGGKLQHAGTGALAVDAAGALSNVGGQVRTNGALSANAGSVDNTGGSTSAQGAQTLAVAGALNNTNGTVHAGDSLKVQAGGAVTNVGGNIEANSAHSTLSVSSASLDNTSGRVVNVGDGVTIVAVQQTLLNANPTNVPGQGLIGGNGALNITAGALQNHGTLSAKGDQTLNAQSFDNSNGTALASGALSATIAGTVNNNQGTLSADSTTLTAASVDNTTGKIEGNQLALTTTGNLVNRGGSINQYSQADTNIKVGGALDSTNGLIAANALNLSVSAQAITNDGGKLLHAGTGTFTLDSQGTLSNVAGQVQTNGILSATATSVDNSSGLLAAQGAQTVTTQGALNNTSGTMRSGDALKVQAGDALTNVGGNIEANGAHSTLSVSGRTLDNTSGRVVNVGDGSATVSIQQTLLNANPTNAPGQGLIGSNGALGVTVGALQNHGTLSAKGDQTITAQSFDNSSGAVAAGTLTANIAGALGNQQGTLSANSTALTVGSLDNTSGKIEGNQLGITTTGNLVNRGGSINQYSQADTTLTVGGALDSTNGLIAANANNLAITAQTATNDGGKLLHAGAGTLTLNSQGAMSNIAGQVQTNGALSAQAGTLDNTNGLIAAQGTEAVTTQGALNNTNGTLHASNNVQVQAGGALTNVGGNIEANNSHSTLSVSAASLDNTSGRVVNVGDGATTVSVQQTLLNANPNNLAGRGLIGGNGSLGVTAGALNNHSSLSAKGDASLTAQVFDNSNGAATAGGALTANVTGALTNQVGLLSSNVTTVSAGSLDNSSGRVEGNQLGITTTGDLVNRGGAIAQYSQTDTTLQVGGTLDDSNGAITANAKNFTVNAGAVTNDGGKLLHSGTGALTLTSTGVLSNVGGQIQTNGNLTTQSSALDNTHGNASALGVTSISTTSNLINKQGTVYGQAGLTLNAGGQLDNSQGSAQTAGNLSATAAGALQNGHGVIAANGAHGTATVAGASIDNTSGRVVNAGDGATTVTATTSLKNDSGALGGNGDVTLNAQTLSNTGGGTVASGGALALNTASQIDNRGGLIYGAKDLTLNQTGATLANDGGSLQGGQDAKINVASITNGGGNVRANRDVSVQGGVSGSGEMTAGRNLTLQVTGDYTNGANNHLRADGNMSLSASGTFTNSATLGAAGNTSVSAANVVNTASGDITGANTTVTASNTISNAGRIEGDTVQTNSATLANTGTVIGRAVQTQANDITNAGAAALIAAAQDLKIYANNSVSNLDGATIYSAGNLQIAKDGARDPNTGMLIHQVGTLTNRSADIEADGDIDIAAKVVNNTRTSIVTAPGTPTTVSQTLATWYAGFTGLDMQYHQSITFPSWSWSGQNAPISASLTYALMQPITVTVDKSTVTSLNTTGKTLSFTTSPTEQYRNPYNPSCDTSDPACTYQPILTRSITSNPTQYYQSITDNGSTYSITFWPDWDPSKNIRPDQVRVRLDLGSDSHDYNETQRTTTTTTTTDQLVSASAAARIRASGNIRINSDGGSILNESSTMAAGGNLVRSAAGGAVTDRGTVLQQSTTTAETSTFYWHQKTGGDQDTQVVPYPTAPVASTTVDALPAIASANQAVQTNAQTINVTTVNRLGQTVTGSGGLAGGGASATAVGSAGNGAAGGSTVTGSAGSTVGSAGTGAANAGTVAGNGGSTVGSAGSGAQNAGALSGTATNAVGAASGSTHAQQTLGTASGGIPNLTLPINGLFHFQTAPGATYLVATDTRFTQYNKFISSDYMLGQLGLNPQTTEKRLGDGFYEEKLVRDQVTQLTGRTFLAGYSDQLTEYQALMDSGVKYAKSFNLAPGIGLTDAQMAQLTTDIVWLVSQDVTLPDGSRQTVLVPKLYLAQANTVDLNSTGALVTGKTVSLAATGDLNNSGRIVGDVATQVLGNNIVNQGTIGGAGSATSVQALQDVRNLGGTITGQDVGVVAGRDVINSSQLISNLNTVGPNQYTAGATGIGAVGTISATNNATVAAGRDINMQAGAVAAGNTATLAAGRDLNLSTVQTGTTQDAESRGGLSYSHDKTTTNVGSTVAAGQNVVAVAGRDATLVSSTVQAGNNASVVAGRNVTETAALDSHTHSEGSLGADANYKKSSYDETASGSAIQAGNNATLGAGQTQAVNQVLQATGIATVANQGPGNVSVLGSSVTTGNGAAKLVGTGDVTIGAVTEKHTSNSWSENKHSGFLSSEQTTKVQNTSSTNAVGSSISGDSVTAAAGHDLTVQGSTVAATNDVNLQAGNNLTVTTAQNTSSSYNFEQTTKSGFGAMGGLSYGKRDQKDTMNDNAVTQTASMVGSTGGNVNMTAGNALTVTGSQVIAAKDITGTGADVTIQAAQGSTHHDETHEVKQSGVSVGVVGGAIGAAVGAVQMGQNAAASQSGRAAALWGIAGARSVYDTGSALASSGGDLTKGAAVSVSFGTSQSKQTMTDDATQHTGSSITAGGKATFTASGSDANGNKTAGDVNIVGSDVNAKQVALSAKRDVNIVSATDTDESHSRNESSSASIGVQVGSSGFAVSASASKAKGNADSTSATQLNSHVNGSGSVSIVSGNDTNVLGGVVSGGKVSADVGGNLNLASRQDTAQSNAKQDSIGGGFTIGTGGGSASFSASHGSANGTYANVTEQSGVKAGDGGFDINVKGNTDLKGAVIASTATSDKNKLTTGTLTWSDVQNHSDYSADSFGISGGMASGNPVGQSGKGQESGKNTGGLSPMIPQSESGSQSGVAQAAVSQGSITITNKDAQKQDVATLNRDTSNTNTTVGKNPDLNNILSQQSDMMAAAQAAGEAVAKTVGDIAGKKEKEAQARLAVADTAYKQDPSDANKAALDAAQADAKGWAEGGDYRAALHMAGGALIAGLGGGNALAGAVGAGVSSKLAPQLQELGKTVAGGVNTGNADLNETIGNLAANIAAGGIGVAVGGGSGAATAANVDRFNRQLHEDKSPAKDEKKVLAQLQEGQSPQEQQRLADAACALVRCADQMSDANPAKADALASQQRGAQYTDEQRQLKATGLFAYGLGDAVGDLQSRELDWAKQQVLSAARGAVNMGNQFVNLIKANNGQTPQTEPNPLVQANYGNPPNTGAAPVTPGFVVCEPPICTVVPASPGTRLPSNAIASHGSDNDSSSGALNSTGSGTSNGTANAATAPRLADDLASKMSKPVVTDGKLAGLMDDLYRDGAKIGSGSTADAVRYENATGEAVGGVFHSQKAQDYSIALQRWLEMNPSASFSDRSAAQNVLRDLQNALRGK